MKKIKTFLLLILTINFSPISASTDEHFFTAYRELKSVNTHNDNFKLAKESLKNQIPEYQNSLLKKEINRYVNIQKNKYVQTAFFTFLFITCSSYTISKCWDECPKNVSQTAITPLNGALLGYFLQLALPTSRIFPTLILLSTWILDLYFFPQNKWTFFNSLTAGLTIPMIKVLFEPQSLPKPFSIISGYCLLTNEKRTNLSEIIYFLASNKKWTEITFTSEFENYMKTNNL